MLRYAYMSFGKTALRVYYRGLSEPGLLKLRLGGISRCNTTRFVEFVVGGRKP